jgi:DNA-directed RNA polymerase subunit RPC12/RpoP
MTETAPQTPEAAAERVHISCPGCGRHDWVDWPQGQDTLHWKCFNCSKEFDLPRHGRH